MAQAGRVCRFLVAAAAFLPLAAGCAKEKPSTIRFPITQELAKKGTVRAANAPVDTARNDAARADSIFSAAILEAQACAADTTKNYTVWVASAWVARSRLCSRLEALFRYGGKEMSSPLIIEDLRKIFRAGGEAAFAPLMGRYTMKLFARYPDAFVRIAEAAGGATSSAFYTFTSSDIRYLFDDSPDSVVVPFVGIANAAGPDKEIAFTIIRGLGVLFVRNPYAFLEIAQAAGNRTGMAFINLEYLHGRKRFIEYCDKKITLDQFMSSLHM